MPVFTTVLTDAEKLAKLKNEIISQSNMGIELHAIQHKRVFDMIWHNPDFTPQQVLDSFGTDAHLLFEKSAATQAYLKSQDPSYQFLEPLPYRILADGRVEIL